jgi:hypothetical protein
VTIANLVDQALRAATIPFLSVSIGSEGDRATWRVVFAENATQQQRDQAATILATVDVTAAALNEARIQGQIVGDKLIRAIVIWAAGKFGVTPLVARQEIAAILRTL